MASLPKFKNLTFSSDLGGMTGTKLYKNARQRKWIVKKAEQGGGEKQVLFEAIANEVYSLLGIPVPGQLYDVESKSLIKEFIDGKLLKDLTPDKFEAAAKELRKGFVVDCLLANRDVIGPLKDNVMVRTDGVPFRIDSGGSFSFRGSGTKKPFDATVVEIATMRDPQINPNAAEVFADLTENEITYQTERILRPNKDAILDLVTRLMPPATPDIDAMKERLDFLLERTLWVEASKEKSPPVEPSVIPEYVKPVQKELLKYFRHIPDATAENYTAQLKAINTILKMSGSIVCGGFLLSATGFFKYTSGVDIDIYIPTENYANVLEAMRDLFNPEDESKTTAAERPHYEKFHIKSVTQFYKINDETGEPVWMDLVEIDTSSGTTPQDVVRNTELSFLENWYDGESFYSVYPEHLKTKAGFLNSQYLSLYYDENHRLLKRMSKYIKRGFKVSLNNPKTGAVEDITETVQKMFTTTNRGNSVRRTKKNNKNANANNAAALDEIQNSFVASNAKVKVANIRELRARPEMLNLEENPLTPLEKKDLTVFQYKALGWYTGTGYSAFNKYLSIGKIPDVFNVLSPNFRLLKLAVKKFPKEADESDEQYADRIMFYICVNLYNGVARGIKAPAAFQVCRGARSAYLDESTTHFHYINSFVSTSIAEDVAERFGDVQYRFLVHPSCVYAYIDTIAVDGEDEVLFTPYHRYVYITTMDDKKFFALFPVDIALPSNFKRFQMFRTRIQERSKAVPRGGVIPNNLLENMLTKNWNRNKTVRRNRNLNMSGEPNNMNANTNAMSVASEPRAFNNNTRRKNRNSRNNTNNTNANADAPRSIYTRFAEPIASFRGNPLTEEEKKMVEELKVYIESQN